MRYPLSTSQIARRVRVIFILDRVTVEDITADVVRAAVAEHDELGLSEFCRRYGFDRGREYVITEDGRKYGARVILAAAHGRLPGQEPLLPHQLGTDDEVNAILRREGFEVKELRPPSWTERELILACSLLFKNGRKALRATDPKVEELSALLRRLPFHAPEERGRQFRSPNSVQRKLYDLMTRLPDYRRAKTRAGQLDEVVLQSFLDDEDAMHAKAAAIARSGSPKAWAMFSSNTRKYGGNTGYDDVLGVQYVYDNTVPNHRKVTVGDLVVIRDAAEVHGVGRIHDIKSKGGVTKPRRVCPGCGFGRFDERKVQRPRYRCRTARCHMEFDEPVERSVEVTQYVALYSGYWRPLDGAIDLTDLKTAFLDDADQNAIRSVDANKLREMLKGLSVPLPPELSEKSGSPQKSPRGGRRSTVAKARNGQGEFRKGLLRRYGSACAITGPCPTEALQAAHLRPFAEHETHDLDEGVLLRADLHLLYDQGLFVIDPESWTVVLAPSLREYADYAKLSGVAFVRGPSPEAIKERFDEVTASWSA